MRGPDAVEAGAQRGQPISAEASIVVRVFGTPPARDCPPARTWEAAARWIGSLLSARFGDRVRLEYVDLL